MFKMDRWNCCRTCLDSQCLNPIFSVHDNNKQLIEMLNFTVGIKVEANDNLPQHICLKCLNFLYEMEKFRKKVDIIQKELQKKLECNEYIKIKPEKNLDFIIEHDIKTSIEAEDSQDDFKDFDDKTTLDNFQDSIQKEFHKKLESNEYIKIKLENNLEMLKNDIKTSIDTEDSQDDFKKFCDNTIFNNLQDNIQNELHKGLESNEYIKIKSENNLEMIIENDVKTSIDAEDSQDDFKDFDDNTILDNLQDSIQEELHKGLESNEHIKIKPENNLEIIIENNIKTSIDEEDSQDDFNDSNDKLNDSERSEEKERIKEQLECNLCHKMYTSKQSMRNHYRTHTGISVVCEHCDKKFTTRIHLLMHCRAKHGYEKTDKCSYCDYTASNAEQVKIHERIHTGEKPFVCTECGAGFHRKANYRLHVATHLPENTVPCDQCPLRFQSELLMRRHASQHRVPLYRFRCGVCGTTFTRRASAVRHLTRIHAMQPDAKHIFRLKI